MPVEAGRVPAACRGGGGVEVLKKPVRTTVTGLGGLEEKGREERRWAEEGGEARWQEDGDTSPLPCLSHRNSPRGFPTGGRGFFAKRLFHGQRGFPDSPRGFPRTLTHRVS
jgi:hypothetical protein